MGEVSHRIRHEIARMSEDMRSVEDLLRNAEPDKPVRAGTCIELLRGTAHNLILSGNADEFLRDLPHMLLEEYELHVILLSHMDDFDKLMECIDELQKYTKEWEVFKLLMPAFAAKRNTDRLFPHVMKWLKSENDGAVCLAMRLLRRKYIRTSRIWSAVNEALSISDAAYCVINEKASFLADVYVVFGESEVGFLERGVLDRDLQLRVIRKAKRKSYLPQERLNYLNSL